jgi:hypothetical protein
MVKSTKPRFSGFPPWRDSRFTVDEPEKNPPRLPVIIAFAGSFNPTSDRDPSQALRKK